MSISVRSSGIRTVDKLPGVGTTIFTVMNQLARETGAIDLSQGFPDFPVDPRLIDLVASAMRAGANQYAPMPGLPRLREAIAAKIERCQSAKVDPDQEITITAGATQAIFTAIAAMVHPGDEVIIIDPAYDSYAPSVRMFGGTPVHVPLDQDMGFNAAAVAAAITARTRMLMINTPHNPGGRTLRESDMLAIREMLKGTDILLLSDEVYEHIIFDGRKHVSALADPVLRERSVVVFSFGKTFHGTGWKIGHAVAPAELTRMFRKVHQFNVFSVNTPMQHAIAEHLQEPDHYLSLPRSYQSKRDRFLEGLKASRFRALPCEGSYFMVADHTAISEEDDMTFTQRMAREHGVAAIPLSPFYGDPPKAGRLVRFCFAKREETLDKALERLCAI